MREPRTHRRLPRSLDDVRGLRVARWIRESTAGQYDRYGLDGRNPNTYANILWCFGKHDRPWGERQVFGTVRTMTDAGLRRKCDIAAYVARIALLGPATAGIEAPPA